MLHEVAPESHGPGERNRGFGSQHLRSVKVNGVRKFIYSGKLNFTMVVFFFIQKTELGFAIDFEMYFSLKWKEIVCTVFFCVY